MRKLMIAAAIVCAAAFANASTCSWGCPWFYAIDESHSTYDPGTELNGTYMILLGSTVADVTVSNDGTITYDTEAFTQVAAGSFLENEAKGSIDLASSNVGKYLTLIAFSDEYQIDGNNIYGIGSSQLAGAKDDPPTDFTTVKFTNDGGGYFVLNQAAQAVPEPTSGLLLLLGVAGLALKRRRA